MFWLILAGLVLFFLLVMAVDCNRFVIREYTCTSDKLNKEGDVLLLSDLHNKSFGPGNRRLMNAIDGLAPDVILMAGDMYTAMKEKKNDAVADFVCRLAGKYPVYYGIGNHEQKTEIYPEIFGSMYADYRDRLKKAGVVVLQNETVRLPEYHIKLYGLEIDRHYYQKFARPRMEKAYLDGILGRPETDSYNILIAHNPDYFKEYAEWGAELVVSGHVHGGLMRLPVLGGCISPRLRIFPHYDGGEFREKGSTMILGRGLGTHTLPIRIFNPGELVVIHLKKS